MSQLDTSIYKKNVFNANNKSNINQVASTYVSDEDDDTESYHYIGVQQSSSIENQKLGLNNILADRNPQFNLNGSNSDVSKFDSENYVNYDISLNPDDSNDLPGDNEDLNNSYLINEDEAEEEQIEVEGNGTSNVSYSTNRAGLQSVIYKNSSKEESSNNFTNPENSKNSLILTNSMIQTVSKSPNKGNHLNHLGMFSSYDNVYDDGSNNHNNNISNEQAQWRLYRDGQRKLNSNQQHESDLESNHDNMFDSLGFQGVKLQNPIHENVKQVSSEIASSSGSEIGSSNDNIPMKNINALNTKNSNHKSFQDYGNESIGPATEAARVFDKIVFKNNLGLNNNNNDIHNNKAETTMDLEMEEKDDSLPPFGFDKNARKIYKNNDINNPHVLITGKSGFSSATTAVASASSNNHNNKPTSINGNHIEESRSNIKHKSDLSTTTPEDIGMIYHESNAVWNWKGNLKSFPENHHNDNPVIISHVTNENKSITVNPIASINNSNSLQNNSEDVINTEQIMARQSFFGNRFVSKKIYNETEQKENIKSEKKNNTNNVDYDETYDHDGAVSDLSQPFKIQGLQNDISFDYENEDQFDEKDEDSCEQESIDSAATKNERDLQNQQEVSMEPEEYHVDINSISKESFEKLSQMLDESPFDLNLASNSIRDVLENLAILEELNPFLLKLDLSINDNIQFNDTNNSISKLLHLKELIMKSMHLKDLNFLNEGTHLHLEHLNLTDNNLTNFEIPKSLSPLISLKTLNLSKNKFNEHLRLDLARIFPNLEFLNLNGNPDLKSLELIVPATFNLKKLSLNGAQSLQSIKFFAASGSSKNNNNNGDNVNMDIDEFQISQSNLAVIHSLSCADVTLHIKCMKLSLIPIDVNPFLDLEFPEIDNLIVKNSFWDNFIFSKLKPSLQELTLSNILSDLNHFDSKLTNKLSQMKTLTVIDTNLSAPINPFYDFIYTNLGMIYLKELNIRDNRDIKINFFKENDFKKTKVFRIATSIKFENLTTMDGFDLLKIWEDKR